MPPKFITVGYGTPNSHIPKTDIIPDTLLPGVLYPTDSAVKIDEWRRWRSKGTVLGLLGEVGFIPGLGMSEVHGELFDFVYPYRCSLCNVLYDNRIL